LLNMQKWLRVALIIFIALLGTVQAASAESMNNSVKDYIEHQDKDKTQDIAPTKKLDQKATGENVGITLWDFLKMIFATIFVVALLYFLLKFINKKSKVFKSTQLVENLGGTTLGANRSVQIVKIGNQIFIVGVGENVQLLKEIDDPDEHHQILTDYNNKMEQLVQPSDIVTKVIERAKKWQTTKTENVSFSSLFKSQLDEISKGRKKLFDEMEKKGSNKQ
jgi:flagellar protein FliO/FliZ